MTYPGEPQPNDPTQPPPAGYGYPPPPPPPPVSYPGYPGPGYPPPPGYPMAAGFPPPGYPVPGYPQPPAHPQATTALVLGILGLVCCGLAAPFALYLGRKSMQEIDASGGQYSGRGQAQAGFILGIIGCALWVFAVIIWIIGFGAAMSTNPGGY